MTPPRTALPQAKEVERNLSTQSGASAKVVVATKTGTLHHTAVYLASADGLIFGPPGLMSHHAQGIEKYNHKLTTIQLHEYKVHYVMR